MVKNSRRYYIRKLFRELRNWDKIDEDFELIKAQANIIDKFKPSQSGGDVEKEYGERMIKFYLLRKNWNIVNRKISNIYSPLTSKAHYTFFHHVCILLALYGLFQLFMLPDVCKEGYQMLHNSYLFITEIMIVTLCLLLLVEIFLKSDSVCRILRIDFIPQFPKLYSVFLFIAIAILGVLFSYSLERGWRELWILEFCESNLIYKSIFLPYVSFIVYFLLNLWDFVCECWNLNVIIPDLKRKRSRLLWKIKSNYEHNK